MPQGNLICRSKQSHVWMCSQPPEAKQLMCPPTVQRMSKTRFISTWNITQSLKGKNLTSAAMWSVEKAEARSMSRHREERRAAPPALGWGQRSLPGVWPELERALLRMLCATSETSVHLCHSRSRHPTPHTHTRPRTGSIHEPNCKMQGLPGGKQC